MLQFTNDIGEIRFSVSTSGHHTQNIQQVTHGVNKVISKKVDDMLDSGLPPSKIRAKLLTVHKEEAEMLSVIPSVRQISNRRLSQGIIEEKKSSIETIKDLTDFLNPLMVTFVFLMYYS